MTLTANWSNPIGNLGCGLGRDEEPAKVGGVASFTLIFPNNSSRPP